MSITTEQLQAASDRFYAALAASFVGDAEPMLALWSDSEDVCYMGPMGELLVGRESVAQSWRDFAATRLGGRVMESDLHFVAGDTIGVVTGREEGIGHNGLPDSVLIRATSTYRLEDGELRMIGHHTDLIQG